ncbi:hypothetical protein OC834_000074 [Tilletia horrida]|nr:hypothetical protein OC834_000074 [Tilletia horrida]
MTSAVCPKPSIISAELCVRAVPDTTFDLTKASLEEQRLAVDATVAHYRGTPFNEVGYKRAVRWRIRVLSFLAVVALAVDLQGSEATRQKRYFPIAADVATWGGPMGKDMDANFRPSSRVEALLVSIEKITNFCKVPREGAEVVEPRPPAAWPQTGEVEFKDLRVKYAPELPDVLKGVSFKVAGATKVGIVGPTGCGKSTTVQSLFRFVEFAGGSIEIDGLDISKVGLRDLRSRIQIVPQDPVILSGTLRDAIDVFHERTDAEILDALRKVRLIRSTAPSTPQLNGDANGGAHDSKTNGTANETAEDSNKNVFEDLSYHIAEGGSNLSNGQRQLLCMARALLGRAKLVVFDEASSSVDTDTDTAITATLREEFSHCTVITIAHRLRTIMHSDQVVMMDKGTVAEVASPAELLQRPESHFYKLCAASGKAEFEKLKELAG